MFHARGLAGRGGSSWSSRRLSSHSSTIIQNHGPVSQGLKTNDWILPATETVRSLFSGYLSFALFIMDSSILGCAQHAPTWICIEPNARECFPF